ncbi:MAG TPA: flagellar hook-associated protein FlgL [Mariprofundaceae bacterium]|nr:flagellar hook-associated protein FlgL [Mariprofundaceae bacterium]
MKVTSQQMYDTLLAGISQQLQTQSTATAQLSSGKRYTRPSQDGMGYKQSLDIRHVQSGLSASLGAISTAKSRLSASQSALSQMQPLIQRAQTIAVQQANATLSPSERQAAVAEVSTLRDQLLALANQKFSGEYLFSGTAADQAAYSGNASIGNTQYTNGANASITNVVQTANPNAINDSYKVTLNATGTAIASVTNSAGTNVLQNGPVSLVAGTNTLSLINGVTLSADYSGTPDTTSTDGGTLAVSGAAFSSTASTGNTHYVAATGGNTSITGVTQVSNPNYVNDRYTIALNAAGTAIDSVTNSAGTNVLQNGPVTLGAGANKLSLTNGEVLDVSYSGSPQTNTAGGTFVVTGAHVGGSYHYNGDAQNRTVSITPTQTVLTNVRGDSAAFTQAFSSMKALQDALNANNVAGIKSAITQLNAAGNSMSELTAEVGGRLHSIGLQDQTYNAMKSQTDQLLSQQESTDIPATVTKLTQAQTALQAAYKVTSNISNISLVNYLK